MEVEGKPVLLDGFVIEKTLDGLVIVNIKAALIRVISLDFHRSTQHDILYLVTARKQGVKQPSALWGLSGKARVGAGCFASSQDRDFEQKNSVDRVNIVERQEQSGPGAGKISTRSCFGTQRSAAEKESEWSKASLTREPKFKV